MSNGKKERTGQSTRQHAESTNKSKSVRIADTHIQSKLSARSVLDVEISGLDDEGYGISCSETHALRIGGALPGDTVRTGIDHVALRMAFGHVKKILVPSEFRSKRSPCRVSSHCLGCPLIAMKSPAQMEWKRQFILKHLREYSELGNLSVNKMLSPLRLSHYRTTARLVISGKHSEPVIGIFRRSSHQVFNLENCPIHHTLVNKVVEVVRRGISKLKVPIYNPRSKMGLLRYLVVRVSEAEQKAMVVFVTSERSYNEIHHLGKFVREQMPEVEVVAQNVNSSEGNVIMGTSDHFLTSKHHLTEKIGDVSLMLSPRSFFQVNRDGAALIYEKVREWACLTGKETVLDLYCGIGGISLTLAPDAKKVIGVEYVDAAVADADKNARLNGITNCTFEAGDAADLLEEIIAEGEKIDVAVLNPPRKGCDEIVLKRVASISPTVIIYVSCSPQSLARDLNILKTLGYSTVEIQPVDMFPQTMHVENVVRLEKTDKSA
jgi:23S rRNA (uracil1939-C5)-methyltransferase